MAEIIPVLSLSGRQVQETIRSVDFAVLPLGSIEYHGPHSPLGTDSILAEEFAKLAGVGFAAVLYPTVYYASCPGKTVQYPGSISIDSSIYTKYLTDILAGICQNGFSNILILNAHDGNMGPARTAAEAVTAKYDASFLLVNWWQLVSVETTNNWGVFNGTGRGHGGPYEMSAVAAFSPETVSVRAEDQAVPTPPGLSALPYALVETHPISWQGYTGNIQEISRVTGERIVKEAHINLAHMLQNWLASRENKDERED